MASSLERLILGLSGQPVAKGQQITPEQRMQSAAGLLAVGRSLMDAAESGQSRRSALLGAIQDAGSGAADSRAQQLENEVTQAKVMAAREQRNQMQRLIEARNNKPAFDASKYGGSYKRYNLDIAKYFENNGLFEEAAKYMSAAGIDKKWLNENKWKEKAKNQDYYDKLVEADAGLQQTRDLLAGGGGGAYAAMVSVLRSLDGSVVKEGEVRAYKDFMGLLNELENRKAEFSGEGLSPRAKAELLNIGIAAFKKAQLAYEQVGNAKRKFYVTDGYYDAKDALDMFPRYTAKSNFPDRVDSDFIEELGRTSGANQGNGINYD